MPTFYRRGRLLLAVLLSLGAAAPASAIAIDDARARPFHARLEASTPAADDTLETAPDSVRLQFSAGVSADLSRLVLRGPFGDSTVLAPAQGAEGRRIIVATLPPLRAGAHVLHWRTTSADGHVLQGEIPFFVSAGAATAVPADQTEPDSADAAASAGQAADADGTAAVVDPGVEESGVDVPPMLPLLRALGTLLLLALAGGLLFAQRSEAAARALLPTLTVLAITAPVAAAGELIIWTTHVAGSLDLGASLQLATGRALLARVVFAVVAALVLMLVRSVRAAAVIALIAVLAGGSLGHASTMTPALSVPLRAVHMAAAAVWLGGLLALGLALRNAPAQRPLLTAVSSAALASFIAVAVTGVGQALVLLGSFDALLQTTYGRLVVVKATGLLLLGAFGYLHRRMIPRVPEGGDASALHRSVVVEILVFMGIILVSGALSFIQLPE